MDMHRPRSGVGQGFRRDINCLTRPRERQRHLRRGLGVLLHRVHQLHRFGAHNVGLTLHDKLGRVHTAPPAHGGIAALSLGMGRVAKGVFPTDIIPVIHVQRQGDNVLPIGQFGEHFIGGGTRGTALRGKEFDHHRLILLGLQRGGQQRKRGENGINQGLHKIPDGSISR